MASSLAADIEKVFGLSTVLKEGHGGVFEVTINGQVVYTNAGVCGRLPETEEIMGRVRGYTEYPFHPSSGVGGAEGAAPAEGGGC